MPICAPGRAAWPRSPGRGRSPRCFPKPMPRSPEMRRSSPLVLAPLLGLVLLAGCADKPTQGSAAQPVDFATIEKPWPYNGYLVCPLDLCPEPTDATSPSFTLPMAQLEAMADKAILAQPGVTALGGDPARHQRIYSGATGGGPVWVQFFPLSSTRS